MDEFEPILGPIFMGTVFNVLLYGIMIMQCYVYFQRYKRDKLKTKLVVGILFLSDTITCGFDIGMCYNYLVTNFANFSAITVLNLELRPCTRIIFEVVGVLTASGCSDPATTAITAFIVQCFFGQRIQTLTGYRMLSILIYSLSVTQLLAGIGTTIGGSIVQKFVLLDKVEVISLVWLIGSLVTDIIITCTLVCFLHKSRTGLSSTDDVISRLVRLTVQTGLITTSFAIAVIIAFFASKNTLMHIAFGLPLSKLYTNSVLSNLNSRQGWPPSGSDMDDRLSSLSKIKYALRSSTFRSGNQADFVRIQYGQSVSGNSEQLDLQPTPEHTPSQDKPHAWEQSKNLREGVHGESV